MITATTKDKTERIVNVFETGSTQGKYDSLVKLKDYTDAKTKSNIVQITYGRSQTTEFGNLKSLINVYMQHNGIFKKELLPYINRIGQKPSLASDLTFCNLLKKAGKTDPAMQASQDDFFDSYYYLPAYAWFNQMGFKLPLSLLVIYDSFIHSGGILNFLRQRFPEMVPVKGGDEKKWTSQYVDVRDEWLRTNKKVILQNTVYRTECLKEQIKNDNWDLKRPVVANRVTVA
ncbi:hypothetical protein ADIARSV_3288 [Arcticibacter svalbardensis MN12-7]|uniref:Chitosanase n=1 Tax=Arcticibacter svalbardensis MN12-7 TaxID=1150600 RepID=R9GPW6_9SPHI|nr:chitosanase [Arcticibacter svalbardensis]EOR93575.1 hypothetical protein ADIARSV_3288 [Arcticibacter svalbardensis MN12-7]